MSKSVFVLDCRPLPPAQAGAIVDRSTGASAELPSRLSTRGLRHVYVDGGLTIQPFLRENLVRRLPISWVPVLIRTGIPLFGPLHDDVCLIHVAPRTFANGRVRSEYEIAPTPSLEPPARPRS